MKFSLQRNNGDTFLAFFMYKIDKIQGKSHILALSSSLLILRPYILQGNTFLRNVWKHKPKDSDSRRKIQASILYCHPGSHKAMPGSTGWKWS